jgi:hypothetical protein
MHIIYFFAIIFTKEENESLSRLWGILKRGEYQPPFCFSMVFQRLFFTVIFDMALYRFRRRTPAFSQKSAKSSFPDIYLIKIIYPAVSAAGKP